MSHEVVIEERRYSPAKHRDIVVITDGKRREVVGVVAPKLSDDSEWMWWVYDSNTFRIPHRNTAVIGRRFANEDEARADAVAYVVEHMRSDTR